MGSPVRVVLDLEISVSETRVADLVAFLRRAVPFYEQPGGIRVTLLRDDQRPGRYIERVEYADKSAFELDQCRVADDPHMKALLAEWRELLQEPAVVRVYRSVSLA
jgi:quinol monooxygenase YgiN